MTKWLIVLILLSGCAVRQDQDTVRVWKDCPVEFDRNGWFISDLAFGFEKPMFPKEIDEGENNGM